MNDNDHKAFIRGEKPVDDALFPIEEIDS